MPEISPSVNPFAPVYIHGLAIPLPQLMWMLQQLFAHEDMDFFHQNDLKFIARLSSPERSGRFAINVKAEFGEIDRINLVISGLTGTASEFENFVDKLQQMIGEVTGPPGQ
jgi:hypothetical protein